MSLTNPNKVITEERLSEFYQNIFPYLGGMPEILANKFNKSDLYSTSEKMIGQWIDGKPLYQNTIEINSQTQDIGETSLAYLGIDKCIDVHIKLTGSGISSGWFGSSNYVSCNYNESEQILRIYAPIQKTNFPAKVTLKYTKSSDSPVSVGNDTDYSTTEKIVGTWIDGKPIYQKTVECGALPNNTTKNVAHNITNISEWISITGISYVNNSGKGGMSLPLVYHNSSSVNNCLLQANSENIILRTEGDRSPYDVTYVTLQYTKTTD